MGDHHRVHVQMRDPLRRGVMLNMADGLSQSAFIHIGGRRPRGS